jgi:Ser/Thr protein kinase RdoA (MazF antagonist)
LPTHRVFPRTTPRSLARNHFGVDGRATGLTTSAINFLIEAADRRIVLKIANAAEDRAMLAAQHDALSHSPRS